MTTLDTQTAPVLDSVLTAPATPGAVALRPHSMADYLATVDLTRELDAAKALAAAYDAACAALIGPNDEQEEQGRKFKKKSAWRKLARHFQISTRILDDATSVTTEWNDTYELVAAYDDPDAKVVKGEVLQEGREELIARVIVEAYAPWGQKMQAIGVCSTYEKRFHFPNGYAKRHADCLATAETRATNRAVSNLIAAGEVSAEEVEGGEHGPQSGKPRIPLPKCPTCNGPMWDNRTRKRKPTDPDFRCKDKQCLDEKGYVTAIFHWKPPVSPDSAPAAPSGESKPAGDTQDPSAAPGPGTVTGAASTTPSNATSGPPSGGSTPTPTTKDPADVKVGGVRLGDMSIEDLSSLIARCHFDPDPKWKAVEAKAQIVKDRKESEYADRMDDDDGFPGIGGYDDLPF